MPQPLSSAGVSKPRAVSAVLKISIFATGLAGIVAEFVLSTLATYIIGNAVLQWTVVMSLMFFAMGLGSRVSLIFRHKLLDTFIIIEFSLSLLCASAAILAYGLAAYTVYTSLLIYTQAFFIGLFIGLEIPLVIRLNNTYQELRSNIAAIMEKDYYGALLGGLLFAFFALPYLGLTYTPIALGVINFLVASLLLWRFFDLIGRKKLLVSSFVVSLSVLMALGVLSKPIILYGEQRQFRDKVIFTKQTPHQKIVITKWKNHYWLYINGQEQFSTFDEEKYHEPLVHPAMNLTADRQKILILGGGDGLALREVLKYPDVSSVTLVDLDPAMTDLAQTHYVLLDVNQGSMKDSRVTVINQDAAAFLKDDATFYGAIFIDLPDPDSVDLMHVYSQNFYRLAHRRLMAGGLLAVQATSPYFSRQAFLSILKTVEAAGFSVLPYHNQIPTLGEWGWVLGARAEDFSKEILKRRVLAFDFEGLNTRFFNTGAMISMAHFGKGILEDPDADKIKINTESNPVLMRYYRSGSWGIY